MDSKECLKCHVVKKLEDFHLQTRGKGGRNPQCKVCRSDYFKEWYPKNKRKVQQKNRRALHQCPIYLRDGTKITRVQYDYLFHQQGGVCAICGSPGKEYGRRLAVDHCHKTRQIRGLLCFSCNAGIGQLKDDIVLLRKAVKYLDEWQSG